MPTFLELPNEIHHDIMEYCIPDDIENYAECCKFMREIAEDTFEEHFDLLRENSRAVRLTGTGCPEWLPEFDDGAEVLRRMVVTPKWKQFYQIVDIIQSGAPEVWCADKYVHRRNTSLLEILKPYGREIHACLEKYYADNAACDVDQYNPAVLLEQDGRLQVALDDVRIAAARLVLLLIANIRRLSITTMPGCHGEPITNAIRRSLQGKPGSLQKLDPARFGHLAEVTLINKSQIFYRTYIMSGYKQVVGFLTEESSHELELLGLFLALPCITGVRAYGIVHLTPYSQVQTLDKPIYANSIILKRCTLAIALVVDMIKKSKALRTFTYDFCPPQHIWRIGYQKSDADGGYNQSSKPRFSDYQCAWDPLTIVKALEQHASRTLFGLDLSSEIGHVPYDAANVRIKTLKNLPNLRIVCLNTTSLPITTSKNSRRMKNVDMVDFLPPSIARVHFCGKINEATATNLFQKHLTMNNCVLKCLAKISSDAPIPLKFQCKRAVERLGTMVFKVIERPSLEKHIPPYDMCRSHRIWNYPNVRRI
ncbi:MAG: hypothetical protein Q9217_005892 [Psora testacea]